jgi:two-component system chemotaxis response regulator CheB
MIKVLIVEDSPVQQALIGHILGEDSGIQVIGTANNGVEALAFVEKQKPDVITMDLNMPQMDGLEATRRIMETRPVPIVIVSANWDPQEVATTFRAMDAGAVAGVEKPRGLSHPKFAETSQQLTQTVKLMSEVKVVRRWAHLRREDASPVSPPVKAAVKHLGTTPKLVAIGASTGGPPVLRTILSSLPQSFPLPILIVQHIAVGFLAGFVEWLSQSARFPIHIAENGDLPLPGHIYLGPDALHLGVTRNGRIALSNTAPENNLRPAVSHLFRSVADASGSQAIGILLTGMGKDGAAELKLMRDRGALTIAQDKESSVVHGMPGEAIQLDAAMYILSPERIVETLTDLMP